MNIPSKCPVCGGNLLNKYFGRDMRNRSLQQSCRAYIGHSFCIVIEEKDNKILYVSLGVKNNLLAWNFEQKSLSSYKKKNINIYDEIYMPFFEPDLSNVPQLIKRCKILRTFL
jgi:hypothetical protein